MNYVACPACGSKCGDELTKCWNCDAPIPPGLPPFGQVTAKIKAEMQRDAGKSKQLRVILLAVSVVLLVGGIVFVGTCSRNSIVTSHFRDGVVSFEHAAKGFPNQYKAMDVGAANAMFAAVLADKPDYDEVYIYRASLYLMQYQYQLRTVGESKADAGLLTKAEDDCNTALRLVPNYPDADYYLSAGEFFQQNKSGCLDYLDKCLNGLGKYAGSPRQQQWHDLAQGQKDYVNGASVLDPTQFNLRPPKDMLPGWELI